LRMIADAKMDIIAGRCIEKIFLKFNLVY